MKRIAPLTGLVAAALLGGCAVYPDGTPMYGNGYGAYSGYNGYDDSAYAPGAAVVPQTNVYLGYGDYGPGRYYGPAPGSGYRGYPDRGQRNDNDWHHGDHGNGHVYEIVSATQGEFTRVAEAQFEEQNRKVQALVENVAKNAPAGSETAVAVMKSAITAANTTYETVHKATRQAVEIAESNFNAAATAASKAASQAAAQASRAAAKKAV